MKCCKIVHRVTKILNMLVFLCFHNSKHRTGLFFYISEIEFSKYIKCNKLFVPNSMIMIWEIKSPEKQLQDDKKLSALFSNIKWDIKWARRSHADINCLM